MPCHRRKLLQYQTQCQVTVSCGGGVETPWAGRQARRAKNKRCKAIEYQILLKLFFRIIHQICCFTKIYKFHYHHCLPCIKFQKQTFRKLWAACSSVGGITVPPPLAGQLLEHGLPAADLGRGRPPLRADHQHHIPRGGGD